MRRQRLSNFNPDLLAFGERVFAQSRYRVKMLRRNSGRGVNDGTTTDEGVASGRAERAARNSDRLSISERIRGAEFEL